jgi:N-acetylglucosamine-6-phosphate deacetylase
VPVTIFTGGPILTMDGATPDPEVVVIDDDCIVAVGAAGLARRYPDARTVDLAGRTLAPGFIDAHNRRRPGCAGSAGATSRTGSRRPEKTSTLSASTGR